MSETNPLKRKASETIKFLTDEGLITKEHSLTVALVRVLAEEWGNATNSTQRAAISKELRAAIEMLPKPDTSVSDEAEDFLAKFSQEDGN